jgi:hypothetical protein
MTIEKIMEVFAPQLEVGLTRINAFKDPEQRDATKIFLPIFQSICRAADIPEKFADVIGRNFPLPLPDEKLDMNTVRVHVELLVRFSAPEKTVRDKQRALDAEIAGVDDRSAPLAERSKDGIEKELWEIRRGCIRGSRDEDGRWMSGEKIPGMVVDRMAANGREERLQAELDRREREAFELVRG